MNTNKTAMEYFDQAATAWDEKPARVALARAVAEAIINQVNLSGTMNAMEFGCGTGLISMALAPMVRQVLAVDMSENMLAVLDKKIKQNQIENISTRRMDLSKDELLDNRFDLIFSGMALHHVKDVDALLGIFHRLLNPGGILAIADVDTEDGGFHGDIPDVFHLGFDREVFAQNLEKKGFSSVKASTAHVIKKESAVSGREEEFSVFLITAVKASTRY